MDKNQMKFKQTVPSDYGYYSKTLKKPFDTLEELKDAEAAFEAEQKAKADKAATKKADAVKVEDAFKAMNAARKGYKENLLALTDVYRKDLEKLKADFEENKAQLESNLAAAEEDYDKALKAFTEKYPEGYHITLKDGDFETTLHRSANTKRLPDLFDIFFGF